MKKVHIKSAVPIYIAAALWLLVGLLFPKFLLKLPGLLVTAALSAGLGFAAKRFFPGRDIEVEEKILTGDAAVDREIEKGRERLENLRKANEAIPDAEITKNLDRMYTAGQQIFRELGRDPRKIALVRRFMNYYLPTSEKLMEQYQILMKADSKGENIQSAMGRIHSSTGLVAEAFEKCVDNMYADEEMDIDAEIKVMQTMLSGDNLVKDETNTAFARSVKDAAVRSAAAGKAQDAPQPAQEEAPKATKEGIVLTLGKH